MCVCVLWSFTSCTGDWEAPHRREHTERPAVSYSSLCSRHHVRARALAVLDGFASASAGEHESCFSCRWRWRRMCNALRLRALCSYDIAVAVRESDLFYMHARAPRITSTEVYCVHVLHDRLYIRHEQTRRDLPPTCPLLMGDTHFAHTHTKVNRIIFCERSRVRWRR